MTTNKVEVDPWGPMPSWAKRGSSNATIGKEQDDDREFDDEDDENDTSNPYFSEYESTRNILILIDMNLQMFKACMNIKQFSVPSERNPDSLERVITISPFDAAILAAEKLFRLRIHRTVSKKDTLGVLLYGTRKKPAYMWQVTREMMDAQKPNNKSTRKGIPQAGGDRSEEEEDNEDEEEEEEEAEENDNDEDESSDYTDESENTDEYSPNTGVCILLPLQSPAVEPILRLRQCLPTQSRLNNYYLGGSFITTSSRTRDLEEELVGRLHHENVCSHDDDVEMIDPSESFINALKECLSMFQEKSGRTKIQKAKDTKAIWIFTNDDNPFRNCTVDQDTLYTFAKDIRDNGINIQLWPMPTDKQDFFFDKSIFFDQVVSEGKSSINPSQTTVPPYFNNVDDMLKDIIVHSGIPHKYQTLPLFLPDWQSHMNDPCIILDLYSLVQVKRKPTPILVHKDTMKRMIKTTELLIEETSELITKDRIRHYMAVGNYHLPISPYEMANVKMSANAAGNTISLILNGFKPRNSLSYTYLMDKALFAYPTDVDVQGSTRAFTALYKSMLKKNVIAIAELLSRKSGTSRQVAVIPHQADSYASDGFLILSLPYRDEVRIVPTHAESVVVEPDLQTMCADLIKHQILSSDIDFRSSFPNPSLKFFWSFIESIALDLPLDNRSANYCNNLKQIQPVPIEVVEAFRALLPEEELPKSKKKGDFKEKPIDLTGINWESVYATNSWGKYKVDELKAFLRSIGGKVSGNKSILIERIKEYWETKAS